MWKCLERVSKQEGSQARQGKFYLPCYTKLTWARSTFLEGWKEERGRKRDRNCMSSLKDRENTASLWKGCQAIDTSDVVNITSGKTEKEKSYMGSHMQ